MDDQPLKSHDVNRTIIINADGTITTLGSTDERATTHPDGSHEYAKTEIRVTTLDGYVLASNDVAFQCTNCGTGPWSNHATTTCIACHRRVCIACTKQTPEGPLCKPCNDALERQAFWTCLWKIT